MRMLVPVIALILTGCSQTPPTSQTTEFLGHHLGESAMEWNLVEDPLGPGPVEVCQEIVKSGVGAETDRYKDCASFLLTGHYFITMRDWKTKRERMFRFEGWKLDTIVEKFQANEFEKVRADLNLRFGVPQKSDSTSASWQESVADIRVSCSTEEGATLVVAR